MSYNLLPFSPFLSGDLQEIYKIQQCEEEHCELCGSGQLEGVSLSVWFTSMRAVVCHREVLVLQNDSQGPVEPVSLLAQLHDLSLQAHLHLLQPLNPLRQVALRSVVLGNHLVDCGGEAAKRHACRKPAARETNKKTHSGE